MISSSFNYPLNRNYGWYSIQISLKKTSQSIKPHTVRLYTLGVFVDFVAVSILGVKGHKYLRKTFCDFHLVIWVVFTCDTVSFWG